MFSAFKKSKAMMVGAGVTLFALMVMAAAFPIYQGKLQSDMNGGGYSITNLNTVAATNLTVVSNLTVQNIIGPATNQFGAANQSPWLQDINGGRFALTNAESLQIQKGATFATNGSGVTSLGVFFSSGPGSSPGANSFVAGDSTFTLGNGSDNSAIVGGGQNTLGANCDYSAIFGGQGNSIGTQNSHSWIFGGYQNGIENNSASPISTRGTVIVGGGSNGAKTNAYRAAILGGSSNVVGDSYTVAMGFKAEATNRGAFVWADSQTTAFSSQVSNTFSIRAQNGVGINTNNPGTNALKVFGNIDASTISLSNRATVYGATNSPTDGYVLTSRGGGRDAAWVAPGSSGGSGTNSAVQSFYRTLGPADEPVAPVGAAVQQIFWQLGSVQLLRLSGVLGGSITFTDTGFTSSSASEWETHTLTVTCVQSNVPIAYPSRWIFVGPVAAPANIVSNQIIVYTFQKVGNQTNTLVNVLMGTNNLAPNL